MSWPAYQQAHRKARRPLSCSLDLSPAASSRQVLACLLACGVLEGGKPSGMCNLSRMWSCWQALPVTCVGAISTALRDGGKSGRKRWKVGGEGREISSVGRSRGFSESKAPTPCRLHPSFAPPSSLRVSPLLQRLAHLGKAGRVRWWWWGGSAAWIAPRSLAVVIVT